MRISFDLDNTIVCPQHVPLERLVPRWKRWWYPEPMRHGTKALIGSLIKQGCHVWIYTTSYRSSRYIYGWFQAVGITLCGVVNQGRHDRVVGRQGPSKYPPAFGIDLHIDDSEGVQREGQSHGFDVVVVQPEDSDWDTRVLDAVAARLNA